MSPSSDHSASSITGRAFAFRRKGFDPDEVRAYLGQLAEIVSRLTAERDLAKARVVDLEIEARSRPAIDEDQLTEILGEETVQVLAAARKASAELRQRAEESAEVVRRKSSEEAEAIRRRSEADAARLRDEAQRVRSEADEARRQLEDQAEAEAVRILSETEAEAEAVRAAAAAQTATAQTEAAEIRARADSDASQVRAAADEVLGVRSAEAEAEAEAIRSRVAAEAEAMRTEAEVRAAAIRAAADGERDAAQAEGREMVAEAQKVRQRMLADLAGRRKAARVQLEQLQAGRDSLLASYEDVRRRLDEATAGLRGALPEARTAAEAARIRAQAEPEGSVEQLEAHIVEARAAGLPLVGDDLVVGDDTESEVDFAEVTSAALPVDDHAAAATGSAPDTPAGAPADGDAAAVVEWRPETAEESLALESTADAEAGDGESRVEGLFARLRASRQASDDSDAPEVAVDTTTSDTDAEVVSVSTDVDPAASPTAGDELAAAPEDSPDDSADAGDSDGAEADDDVADDDPTSDVLTMLERRDGAIEPIEGRVARKLKRVLADEQGRVLDGVRRHRGSSPHLDDILSLDDQVANYAVVVADDLLAAAEEGAAFEGAALPPSTSLSGVADELARTLAGMVRPRVERCFDGGEDAEEISDRLRATYREWKTDRLVETTRHLVLSAFGEGQVAVLPTGAPVRWVHDPTESTCPDCEDDALAHVGSGDPFPTGHAHPPAHPGCRCLVVVERVAASA